MADSAKFTHYKIESVKRLPNGQVQLRFRATIAHSTKPFSGFTVQTGKGNLLWSTVEYIQESRFR
jgi:hypothetical protein